MIDQIIRYGVVGIANNILGYSIYLLLTWLWFDPKVTAGVLYPIGATMAYFGHSKYSFPNNKQHAGCLPKYIIAHTIGYIVNLSLLYVLVDKFLFPHQLVQAVAIILVAGILFLLFKYFVFSNRSLRIS
jgi:putative flippase GtrA